MKVYTLLQSMDLNKRVPFLLVYFTVFHPILSCVLSFPGLCPHMPSSNLNSHTFICPLTSFLSSPLFAPSWPRNRDIPRLDLYLQNSLTSRSTSSPRSLTDFVDCLKVFLRDMLAKIYSAVFTLSLTKILTFITDAS